MVHRYVCVVLLSLLPSCHDASGSPGEPGVSRLSLEQALGTSGVDGRGITIDPDSGELILLDANLGLYALAGDRVVRQVATAETLYAVGVASLFTDVAALGGGRFALTAINDGFLFDESDGSIVQHFCYVPGTFIGPIFGRPPQQLTDSVAFDPITQRILAQPVTFVPGSFETMSSEVGTFPITGGEGQDWHRIEDPGFLAGGMAVDAAGGLWLGRGANLYRYDLDTDTLTLAESLEAYQIREIKGLAFDSDRLLVLDGGTQTLVGIPLGRLGL